MQELSEMKCEACRADAPKVSAEETLTLLASIPDWRLAEADGAPCLEREFLFQKYQSALAFSQRVGQLAQTENHHPRIVIESRRVTVAWWTHKIHGLHKNDFIMAAKTTAAYALEI